MKIPLIDLFNDYEIRLDVKSVFVEPETGHYHYKNETIETPEEAHLVSMPVVAEWREGNVFSFPDFTMRCAFTNPNDPERVVYQVVPFSSIPYDRELGHGAFEYVAYNLGLQLFGFVYNTVKQTPTAAECAYLYRKYNNICHACYGDGVDPNSEPAGSVVCYICNGSGHFDHPKY
jgi:hypothetical protein